MKSLSRLVLILTVPVALIAAQAAGIDACPTGATPDHPCCGARGDHRPAAGPCCSGGEPAPDRGRLGSANCDCGRHGDLPPAVAAERLSGPGEDAGLTPSAHAERAEPAPPTVGAAPSAPEARCRSGSGSDLYLDSCALLI